jgi:hypothetical protein
MGGGIWESPVVHRAVLSYIHTGHVPDKEGPDAGFWKGVEHVRDMDPARFDARHRNIAGYFAKPAILGQLPHGPLIDELRYRFKERPYIFTRWHPFWGRLFAHEPHPVPPVIPPAGPGVPGVPILPPAGPGQGIPEPLSVVSLCSGIMLAWLWMWRTR